MPIGTSTYGDYLTWVAFLLLGVKLLSTFAILAIGRARWSVVWWANPVWWVSAISPVVALLCLATANYLDGQRGMAVNFVILLAILSPVIILQIVRKPEELQRKA